MSLYKTLGVEKSASGDEIKKAYKKAALKYHPDKNSDSDAPQKFKEVTEAYDVLKDEEKRQRYDTTGSTSDAGNGDVNDMFRSFFGGGFHGMPSFFSQNAGPPQHDDMNVVVTLGNVYNGSSKQIEFAVTELCMGCKGEGVSDPRDITKCTTCHGQGCLLQQIGPMSARVTCPRCHGKCKSIRPGKACTTCGGEGTKKTKRSLDINIPRGVPNKFVHEIPLKGNYNQDTKRNNSLRVTFSYTTSDPNVVLDNSGNVVMTIPLTLAEVCCGFRKKISPYDKVLTLYSSGYTNPKSVSIKYGKGLPKGTAGKFSDLIIKFTVVYPDELTARHADVCKLFETAEPDGSECEEMIKL